MQPLTRYVCLGALLILCAQSQPNNQTWLASFDHVWQTIYDKYWDPEINGVNWQAARAELRPKVADAQSSAEARQIMEQLLARLGHSHVGIIPASAYSDLESSTGNGDSGLKIEIIAGDAIIANGSHAGWALREINGRRVRDRISRAKSELYAQLAVRNNLRGEPGETLELLLEDEAGKVASNTLTLTKPAGRLVRFGNLPALHLDLRYQQLAPDCGYVRISSFFDPEAIEDLLRKATTECRNCRGIILDLRGNPGGLGALAASVAGWFLDKSLSLGTCVFRQAQLKLIANPRAEPFLGKLAVLIDSQSMSTSEFLASGLKDLGRARIFGKPTPGAALPSSIEKLPTGDGFQYTTADYTSASGKHLEGFGVEPDVRIEPTREQLRNGIDATRAAALQWIQKD
jgi:carboxyl-terminal processing protease